MLDRSLSKKIKKLHQKKYRETYNSFLIEGIKGVTEALAFPISVQAVIVEEKRRAESEFIKIIQSAIEKEVEVYYAANSDIGDIKTTDNFSGVMAIITTVDYSLNNIKNDKPIIALIKLQDPGNTGTIIRTADWFNMPNILISENSVEVYNEKVVRSTMGSIFKTKIVLSENINLDLLNLKNSGYTLVALDMNGEDINQIEPEPKTVYIFGSESHGVETEIKNIVDKIYKIPGGGTDSLNVGVAVGITLSKITQ